jgi:hypothetical protein
LIGCVVVGGFAFLLWPMHPLLAQGTAAGEVAASASTLNQFLGLSDLSLAAYVGRIIGYALGLVGVVLVVLFIYAGALWMTAQGNAEQIDKAKKIMTNAAIGAILIGASYAITAFIIGLLENENRGGISSENAGDRLGSLYRSTRGRSALGNGIIEYHYPEPGQTGVVRNTKIAVTFKKPLVLSSVLRDYDDKGTFDLCDDVAGGEAVCDSLGAPRTDLTLRLNTDTLRILPVEALAALGDGTVDEQWQNRHPLAGGVTEATVSVTDVARAAATFNPIERQTLVIRPVQPLGSATLNVNYRVTLRGGEGGVKVWNAPDTPTGSPEVVEALPDAFPDGGYHWIFTTSTLIDRTPPQLTQVVPATRENPAARELDRNQLLQAYFDEAVDPTVAAGKIGAAWGFSNVLVQARCLDAADCRAPYSADGFAVVEGEWIIGNRYRTVEFVPTAGCDTVRVNSCGDEIFCLPGNVELLVTARAASVGDNPPEASLGNGVQDMAGNSLDGNGDGRAVGPSEQNGLPAWPLNVRPESASGYGDTVRWSYQVGDRVDLVPPIITELTPPPQPADFPAGYNRVPGDLVIATAWSKAMSLSSMRTGGFIEPATYRDPDSTLVLRSHECEKDVLSDPTSCACTRLDPPGFFVETVPEIVTTDDGETDITVVRFLHPGRPFYTANELGFSSDNLTACPQIVPTYAPIVRAALRDLKQNCFWPSHYRTEAGEECNGTGEGSCCEIRSLTDDAFVASCRP